MYVCDICNKGILRGNAVSHAKNRTKRIFLPNLHKVKVLINGQPKIVRVCTKCLRKVTKAPKRDLSKVTKVAKAPTRQKLTQLGGQAKVTEGESKKKRGKPKKIGEKGWL